MKKDVYGTVVGIISSILHVEPGKLDADTAIGDLKLWDSLHHLQIIAKIEQTYAFKFTPDVMMDLEDVGDIVKAIEDRVG